MDRRWVDLRTASALSQHRRLGEFVHPSTSLNARHRPPPRTRSLASRCVDQSRIYHRWRPIEDLTHGDLEAASGELVSLVGVWQEVRGSLAERRLQDFNDRLKREWAIETGIIERLYTLDEGTTRLLIEQGIDAALISHDASDRQPEYVAGLINDHAEAMDWLFDIVAQRRPLATSTIKQLHQLMTRKQRTCTGVDSLGREVETPLLHGEYKQQPNNPTRADGLIHEYCPPEQVAGEMERLVDWHHDHREQDVPAEVEAAWLHHRFTQIHPFQDGNGRVARAIASLVLLRADWFPLVVDSKDRAVYLSALDAADKGSLRGLIDHFSRSQKQWLTRAIGLADELQRNEERLDHMLDSLVETFTDRRNSEDSALAEVKEFAGSLVSRGHQRFDAVAARLNPALTPTGADEPVWADEYPDERERRHWNRFQVITSARHFGYFANTGDYHAWTRLCLSTRNGRTEMLLSFHTVGRGFRGVIGATLSGYRREDDDADRSQIVDHEVLCSEMFQFTDREARPQVERRFDAWLDESLLTGLAWWREGE